MWLSRLTLFCRCAIFILCFVCFLVNELHSKDEWREAELYEVYIKNNRTVTQNYRQRQYQQNTTTQVSYILLVFLNLSISAGFSFKQIKPQLVNNPTTHPSRTVCHQHQRTQRSKFTTIIKSSKCYPAPKLSYFYSSQHTTSRTSPSSSQSQQKLFSWSEAFCLIRNIKIIK